MAERHPGGEAGRPRSVHRLAVLAVVVGLGASCGTPDSPGSKGGPGEDAGAAAAGSDSVPVAAVSRGWERVAAVPEARTEVSVSTDGERIYLVGGFHEPPEGSPDDRRAPVSRRLLVYDPGTDSWSEAAEVPVGTHHAGLVPIGERLYLVGGYRDNSFEPRSGEVWIYDPSTDAWEPGAPMPTPRGGLAYAVLDGRIHAIGGTVEDPSELDPSEHNPSDEDASVGTHEVYDPADDSWERRSPMPTPRNHHVAGAVGDRIVVAAGRVGDETRLTTTEIYDPATDSWTEGAPIPTGRSGVAGAVLDGRLYVFGGETFGEGGARTFDDAERYDPSADVWERLPSMPTPRHGVGAAVLDETVYVVSGGPRPGFAFGTANERIVP